MDLNYIEEPTQVLDTKERVTRNQLVKLYKLLWGNHSEGDATWEAEDYLQENYPIFYKKWSVKINLGMIFS